MSEKLRKHLGSWYQFPTLVRVLEEESSPTEESKECSQERLQGPGLRIYHSTRKLEQ